MPGVRGCLRSGFCGHRHVTDRGELLADRLDYHSGGGADDDGGGAFNFDLSKSTIGRALVSPRAPGDSTAESPNIESLDIAAVGDFGLAASLFDALDRLDRQLQ